jgi:hypothetical protein
MIESRVWRALIPPTLFLCYPRCSESPGYIHEIATEICNAERRMPMRDLETINTFEIIRPPKSNSALSG